MTNYLLFNVHNAGYSNQLLSLELALGISWLTGRELLLCGEGSDFKKLRSIKGGWFKLSSLNNSFRDSYWREPKNTPVYRESFIYEILSSNSCYLKCFNQSDLAENIVLDDLDVSKIRLSEHFFCSKEDLSSEHGADLIRQFGNGRHALTNSDSKYWHLSGSTLGFYSRFFYNKGQELWNHINSLRPNDLIMKTSQAISSKLGAFNGIHVRLTDFSKMHEPSVQYVDIISKCVGNLLGTGEKLLICTNESKDSLFWVNVLKKVDAKNCIFLDEFIVRECSYEISRLDWINESVWGALCQEIMKDSLILWVHLVVRLLDLSIENI